MSELAYVEGINNNFYKVLSVATNTDWVCIFGENWNEVNLTYDNYYALDFPSFAYVAYEQLGLDDQQLNVPLTVQILDDLFTGSINYVCFCHKDDLPGDIPLRPTVTFNGFMPQTVKDDILAKFTNPVTNG